VDSLIAAIRLLSLLLTLAVLADILVSFILSPYHPVRRLLDSLIDPLLTPIRKVMPIVAGLDFSPMVLIILIQIVEDVLILTLRGLLG
jgi:YggT family protein